MFLLTYFRDAVVSKQPLRELARTNAERSVRFPPSKGTFHRRHNESTSWPK